MNKKNKLVAGCFIVVLLILSGIGWKIKSYIEGLDIHTVVIKDEWDEILYCEQGQTENYACLITDEWTWMDIELLTEGYIYLRDLEYCRYGNMVYIKNIDKAQVNVYDIISKELVAVFDIKELSKDYFSEMRWMTGIGGAKHEGEDAYLYTQFAEKSDRLGDDPSFLCFNIETGEVTMLGVEEYRQIHNQTEREKKCIQNLQILSNDEIGLLKKNGLMIRKGNETWEEDMLNIRPEWNVAGTVYIVTQWRTLPDENELLYTEFPELKNYVGADNDRVYICLGGYPTPEEILSMLIEEGEEISFEGCVLPAESSIDGKEHEIHSFEEYEQWKKYED